MVWSTLLDTGTYVYSMTGNNTSRNPRERLPLFLLFMRWSLLRKPYPQATADANTVEAFRVEVLTGMG